MVVYNDGKGDIKQPKERKEVQYGNEMSSKSGTGYLYENKYSL
jgi:hypothetical protein